MPVRVLQGRVLPVSGRPNLVNIQKAKAVAFAVAVVGAAVYRLLEELDQPVKVIKAK